MQEVHAHEADMAGLVQHPDDEVRVLLELGHEVLRRHLEEVDLAVLQRRERGLLVADVLEDGALDLHHLAAGKPRGGLGARHVVRVLIVDVAVARPGLVLVVEEGAGADGLTDLLVRIALGLLLAHHPAVRGRELGERPDQEPVGLGQHDLERPVVVRRRVLDAAEEVLAGAVAGRPAPERRDAIGRRHRRAVGELETVAELESVAELVVRDAPFADHLRLRVEIRVHGEERVVDHGAVIGGDVRGRPNRVEHAKIGMHHGADGARPAGRRLRPQDGGRRREADGGAAAGEYPTPCRCHDRILLRCCSWRD